MILFPALRHIGYLSNSTGTGMTRTAGFLCCSTALTQLIFIRFSNRCITAHLALLFHPTQIMPSPNSMRVYALHSSIRFMSGKKSDSVTGKIQASLTDLQTAPWLPQLTDALVENAGETLYSRTDISVPDYGTARVLASRPDAPRNITARLPICPDIENTPATLIEALSPEDRRRYQDMGLVFCTPDETKRPAVLNCLQEAVNLLRYEATLQTTIAALVRICHILKPKDDDYDISHSDPQVPFSIFVSVPLKHCSNDVLRVTESIIHEAMHLQLTLIEHDLPLVDTSASTHFSPWKDTCRPPQGVLHALYVFRVIDRFFERLQTLSVLSVTEASYIKNRREEISRQIGEIRTFQESPTLTIWGSIIVRSLLDAENPGPSN